MTYMVITSTLLQVLDLKIGTAIGRTVYDGSIGQDMLKPTSLQAQHAANELGGALFHAVAYALPLLLVAVVCYDLLLPASGAAFGVFLVSAALGRVIAALINCIIGYSAFWLMNNWFMSYFEKALMVLFGGTLVPMWFYPAWLNEVSAYLPFKYVNYLSLDLYLGRVPSQEIPAMLGMQVLWIAVLLLIERAVWHAAQRRITVQGG